MNKKVTRRLMALVLAMCMVVGDFSGVYAAPAKTSKTTTVKASSVKLNKSLITLAKKKSYTLKATIAPKKATTTKLVWSSSNKKVATVNSKGKVVAKNYGTTTIKVKVKGTNKVAKCTVKVGTPVKSVKLNAKTLNMFPKQSKKLTATFTPKKVTVPGVTYTSSNKKVATVDKNGKVVAKKAGTAVITATSKDGTQKKATVKVVVTQPVTKITLKAAKSTLEIGEKTKVTAKIAPSNAKNKAITFTSSNARVAKVDSKGNVTAITEGSAVIKATAKDGSKKYGQVKINVRASLKGISWNTKTLKISKINPGVPVSLGLIIKPDYAHIKSIEYTSSDEKIIKVTKDGQLIGLSNGKANIQVKVTDVYGNSKSLSLNNIEVYTPVKDIKIDYEELNLYLGESKEIKAGVIPETANNKDVIFKSSDETVVTVDKNGLVKAVGEGIANITVYSKENNQINKVCHVTSKIPVEDINIEGKKDSIYETQQLVLKVTATNDNATDKTFTFSSGDANVARIDENGKITAVKTGTTQITVRANGARNLEKKFNIVVKPIVSEVSWNDTVAQISTLEVDSQTQFGYVVKPADADVQLQYQSSNEEVATVDNTGLVTARKNGKATIKLTITDGAGNLKTLEKEIIVKTSVTGLNLSETEKIIYMIDSDDKPAIYQIVYNVLPDTASNTNVTFESDNVNVATVSDSGVVTAVGEGVANITVKTQDAGKTAKIAIKVIKTKAEETVSTSKEVEDALENKNLEVLTIKDATDIQIPEGTYDNVSLVINSPNGHIENYAQFKDVKISAISESTYVEHANNTIDYMAKSGTVKIANDSVATLNVLEGAANINLVNDGNIASFVINSFVNVKITGESDARIPVVAHTASNNSLINTNKNLDIKSDVKLKLELNAGAESTRVQIEKRDALPTVSGLGKVEVTILADSDIETIVGENIDNVTTQKVVVKGSIASTNANLTGVQIYLIPYKATITSDNILSFIDENTICVTSDEDGKYETGEITIGNYYLYAKKDGYQDVITTLVLTSNNINEFFVDKICMVEDKENASGNVEGKLINAQTGKTVEAGITLKLREGVNNVSGSALLTTLTTSEGTYSFANVPVGQYTIQVIDNRESADIHYVLTSFNIVVEEGNNIIPDNSISGTLEAEQIRFVLTWGNQESGAPADLDSHLIGPGSTGENQFHTWYGAKGYYENDIRYADLDVDDTSWEGPETTTIYQKVDGVYHFYVRDFSNRSSDDSNQLSNSQAVVKVYIGGHLIETYSVPNQPGTLWKVCDFDSKTLKITPVNKMSYWFEEESLIGIDARKLYMNRISDNIDLLRKIEAYITDDDLKKQLEDLISKATKIQTESDDVNELYKTNNELLKWIDTYNTECGINDIYGDDVSEYVFYTDGTDEDVQYIRIDGYTSEFPEIKINLHSDDATYVIEDSDKADFDKKINVVSPKGYYRTWYIKYQLTEKRFDIDSISCNDERFDYSVNDYNDYKGISIEGYSSDMPDNLVIKTRYSKATMSEIKESDKDEYQKMFTVTVNGESKAYYIKWTLSVSALGIKDINYEKDGINLILKYETDWYYDDNDNEYNIVDIYGLPDTLPQDIKFTFKFGETPVQIKESDKAGYTGMFDVAYETVSRRYYIRYNASKFSIDNVMADDSYISYTIRTDTVGNDNINVIAVTAYIADMPANWTIRPSHIYNKGGILVDKDDISTTIEDSDIEGYIKKVTLSWNEYSTVYYLKYEVTKDSLQIAQVKSSQTDEEYRYGTEWSYKDDKKIDILTIYGKTSSMPDDLQIVSRYRGAKVEIVDSDNASYEKMVKISVQDVERIYYIVWKIDENLLNVNDVKAFVDDKNIITAFGDDLSYDDDQNAIYKLSIVGLPASMPQNLKFTFRFGESSVEIKESDKAGYAGMFDVTYETISRRYYIEYNSSSLKIDDVRADDVYLLFRTRIETVGNDNINVIAASASSSDIPDNWVVRPSNIYNNDGILVDRDDISTTIEDSDIEGYIKKVTLSWNEYSTVYYLKYEVTKDSLQVAHVKSSQTDDYYTHNTKSVYEDDKRIDILTIYGKTSSMADDLQISAVYNGAKIEIVDSDNANYEKMVKISAQDVERIYYIVWKLDENLLDVNDVKAFVDDKNVLTGLDDDWNYDDDGNKFYIISITGLPASMPQNLKFTFGFGESSVEIKESDKAGYAGMFDVAYETVSRRYYVKYNASRFNIDDVYADDSYIPYSTRTNTVGNDSINVIAVIANSSDIPSKWTVTPSNIYNREGLLAGRDEISTTVEDSDIEGYIKKVTLSWNGYSTVYYLKYELTKDSLKVAQVKSSQTDEECIYETDWLYEDDKRIDILTIYGKTSSMPDDLQIVSRYNGAKVEIVDSDNASYEKMVKISAQDVERIYYIVWKVDENLLNVNDVKAFINDNDIITDFGTDWNYDDNEDKVYTLSITGLSASMPQNLKFTCGFGESSVEIKESDKDGYAGMFDVAYETISRRYYIQYNTYMIDVSYVCIDNSYIPYRTRTDKVGDNNINVIAVSATSSQIPTYYEITPYNIYNREGLLVSKDEISTTVEDSDIEGYLKKVTFSWNEYSTVYYLKYEITEESLEIEDIKSSQTDEVYRYETNVSYEGDKRKYTVTIYGKTATIPDDLQITTRYSGAKAEIVDSDNADYEKMLKISAQDVEKIYYIVWKIDENLLVIENVKSLVNDKNIITEYSNNFDYDDNRNEIYTLSITGLSASIPQNLKLTCGFGESQVEVKESDKDGYAGMLDVTYGTISRRYYIQYNTYMIDVNYVCIDDSYIPYSTRTDKVGDNNINVIAVPATSSQIPTYFEITPYNIYNREGLLVSEDEISTNVEDSDMEGYLKKVTFSWNGFSTVYYLKFELTLDSLIVDKVNTSQSEGNLLYSTSSEEKDGKTIDTLTVRGKTETIPDDLQITAVYSDADIEIVDSDIADYEKMVKISAQGIERIYYLIWEMDENLLNVSNVKCMVNDKNVITRFRMDWDYDDNKNKFYTLSITGLGESIPENIKFVFDFGESSVEIKDSDKDGYAGMFDVTYGTISRRYYISYTARLFETSNICADGQYVSYDTKTESVENNTINVLSVSATSSQTPEKWDVKSYSVYNGYDMLVDADDITTTIEDSDIEGYLKKITLSWNEFSTVYYLKYEVTYNSLSITDIKSSQAGDSYKYENDTEYIDDVWTNIYTIYGKTASIPEDIQFEIVYKDATVQILDSDISDYDKKVKISAQGVEKICYIIWKIDDSILDVEGYKCIRHEKNIITGYEIGYDYDDENNKLGLISLTGFGAAIPDDLTFEFGFGESSVDMKDSDKDDYDKMFDITYETISRRYYVKYEEYKFQVAGVAVAQSQDSESYLDVSYEIATQTVNDKNINVIKVAVDNPQTDLIWKIYMDNIYDYNGSSYIDSSDVTVNIEDSDIEGYIKKVTLSWNEYSTVYYMKYATEE